MRYFRTQHQRWIAVILGGLLTLAVAYQVKSTELPGLFGGVIAGGGGTSTGSPYQIKGTLGQPVSNTSQGSQFGVQAGFWPGAGLLPTPGLTTTPTALPGTIAQGQAPKVDNAIAVWEENRASVWNIFGRNLVLQRRLGGIEEDGILDRPALGVRLLGRRIARLGVMQPAQ